MGALIRVNMVVIIHGKFCVLLLYRLIHTISLPVDGGRLSYRGLPSRHYSLAGGPDSRDEAIAYRTESLFSPSLPLWLTVRAPSALVPGSPSRGSLALGQT